MVDFTAGNDNKYQPDSAGEFLRWPKEESSKTFPSSFAELTKGITSAVETGAEELNKGVKNFMKNLGYKEGQQEQSDMLKGVQTAYGRVFGNKGTTGGDTLTPGASAAPKDVDEGLAGIKSLKTAYDQGGVPRHLRETEYYGNLYMRAQALRTRFPGYRDYIDKGIEEATGITPNANAYIKNMLADINEMITKGQDKDKHVVHGIQTEAMAGNPHAVAQMDLVRQGKDPTQAGIDLGKSNLPDWQTRQAENRFKTMDANSKVAQSAVEETSRSYLNANAGNHMRDTLESLGLTEDKLDKMSKGELTFEQLGVDPRQVLAHIQNQKRILQQRHDNYWNAPVMFSDGTTTTRRAAIKDRIDSVNKDVMTAWDELEKAFTNKDAGYIGRVANSVKDMNDNALFSVWNSDKGGFLRATRISKEMGGDQLIPLLVGSSGFGDKPTVESINAMIGSTLGGDSKTKPGLRGMKEALGSLDKETHGENPKAHWAYITALSKLIGSKAPTEAQANVLEHLFDPKFDKEDTGWLGMIQENGTSVSRHRAYAMFANPAFAKNVEKVAGENNRPELITNYQNFIRTTFGQDLFRHDISELGKYQFHGYTGGTRAGVDLVWKTPEGQEPRFVAYEQPGFHVPGIRPQARAQAINDQLTRLNSGIKALYGVFGKDTAGILLNEFGQRGLELGEKGSLARELLLTMKPQPTTTAGKEAEAGKKETSTKTKELPVNDTSGVPKTWGDVLPKPANEWISGAAGRMFSKPGEPNWYRDLTNAPIKSRPIGSNIVNMP